MPLRRKGLHYRWQLQLRPVGLGGPSTAYTQAFPSLPVETCSSPNARSPSGLTCPRYACFNALRLEAAVAPQTKVISLTLTGLVGSPHVLTSSIEPRALA